MLRGHSPTSGWQCVQTCCSPTPCFTARGSPSADNSRTRSHTPRGILERLPCSSCATDQRIEPQLARALDGGTPTLDTKCAVQPREAVANCGFAAADSVGYLVVREAEQQVAKQLHLVGSQAELPADKQRVYWQWALASSESESPTQLELTPTTTSSGGAQRLAQLECMSIDCEDP